jgi:endo-1,4-beta-xylanase
MVAPAARGTRSRLALLIVALLGLGAVGAVAQPRAAEQQTLRQLAGRHRLWIGTAVNTEALAANGTYARLVAREFSSVTPENVMKWMDVEPARGVETYVQADRLVAFARAHGQTVRGHTLVWHSQLPGWLTQGRFSSAELRRILRKHVTDEVSHFRGEVYAWDVVNEPLADDGSLRATIWERALGPGYIARALEWAHAADPKAKLYLNDYGIEGAGRKPDAMYRLVKGLVARHVPLDGVGFESHLAVQYGFPARMAANMRRFAALGLDVAITEADVRMPLPATKASLATQAADYGKLMQACLAVERCVSFTVWGFSDRYSWIPGWFPGEGAADLLDARFRPKPAYDAIRKLLAKG